MVKDHVVKRKWNKFTEAKKKKNTLQHEIVLHIVQHYLYQNTSSISFLVVVVFFVYVVVSHSQNSEFLRACVNVSLFPLFDLHCHLQGSEIRIFLTLMFPRCVQVYGLIVRLHTPRKQGKEANINISPYTVTKKSVTVMSQLSAEKHKTMDFYTTKLMNP